MNVQTIDLCFHGHPHAIAVYLVGGPDGPLLVECGPGSATDALVAALAEIGLAPGDIRDVLVTHIHLDHAGAAGWWARQGARIHVHHLGAPHLADPTRLLASAGRIYGDDMDRLWGRMLPVPADKLSAVHDGDVVRAGGLAITAVETPGHAAHHHVYHAGDLAFTGDAAGVRLPGESLIALPAPPPEFDLEAWDRSLDRLAALGVASIYPTHFGPCGDVGEHVAALRDLLHASAARVRAGLERGLGRDALVADYVAWNRDRARAQGVSDAVWAAYDLANPLFMSVDGITRYWRKRGIG